MAVYVLYNLSIVSMMMAGELIGVRSWREQSKTLREAMGMSRGPVLNSI